MEIIVGIRLNNIVDFYKEKVEKTKYNENTGDPYIWEHTSHYGMLGNLKVPSENLKQFYESWEEVTLDLFDDRENPLYAFKNRDEYHDEYFLGDIYCDESNNIELVIDDMITTKDSLKDYLKKKFNLDASPSFYVIKL